MRRFFTYVAAALFALSPLTMLTPASAQNISDNELFAVVEAENVLNSIRTARGRFAQQTPDGGFAWGNIAIKRPGRLFFEYDPPEPTLIMADGTWVILIDRELENTTHRRITRSPLYFLLEDQVDFTNGVCLVDVVEGDQLLEVTVQRIGYENDGFLTLIFNPVSKELLAWRTIDGQGEETIIQLADMSYEVDLPNNLFKLPPGYGKERDR